MKRARIVLGLLVGVSLGAADGQEPGRWSETGISVQADSVRIRLPAAGCARIELTAAHIGSIAVDASGFTVVSGKDGINVTSFHGGNIALTARGRTLRVRSAELWLSPDGGAGFRAVALGDGQTTRPLPRAPHGSSQLTGCEVWSADDIRLLKERSVRLELAGARGVQVTYGGETSETIRLEAARLVVATDDARLTITSNGGARFFASRKNMTMEADEVSLWLPTQGLAGYQAVRRCR